MEQKNQKWNKLLRLVFEYPRERFTLRQIVAKTHVPLSTLARYLVHLQKENLIDKNYQFIENTNTRWCKTAFMINLLFESGLTNFLEEKLKPGVIVLFGSVRKGEYDVESDIDLFVEAAEQKINLAPFEKTLGHRIHIVMKPRLCELPKELKLSIVNGIKLSGYLNYAT